MTAAKNKYIKLKIAITILLISQPVRSQNQFLVASDGPIPEHLVPLSARSFKLLNSVDGRTSVLSQSIIWGIAERSFGEISVVALIGDLPDSMQLPNLNNQTIEPKRPFEISVTTFDYKVGDNSTKLAAKAVTIIPEEIAIQLQRLWVSSINQARYPGHAFVGLDGNRYIFGASFHLYGDIAGETWSPEKGLSKEMADLLEQLEGMVVSGEKNIDWKGLGTKIDSISRALPKNQKNPDKK